MTPKVVVNENGVHIITGPGYRCECGIDDHGNARSCLNIIEELVQHGVHEYLDGKTPKGKPMNAVQCKAKCFDVKQDTDDTGKAVREYVSFCAVCSEDPNSENKWFAQYTPSLSISQTIDNPNAIGTFQKGKEYYVTFEEAPCAAATEVTADAAPTPVAEAVDSAAEPPPTDPS